MSDYQEELNELHTLNKNKNIIIKLPIFEIKQPYHFFNYDANLMIGYNINNYNISFNIDDDDFDKYNEYIFNIPLYKIICNAGYDLMFQTSRYFKFEIGETKNGRKLYKNYEHLPVNLIEQRPIEQYEDTPKRMSLLLECGLNKIWDYDIYYKIYENNDYVYIHMDEERCEYFEHECSDIECYYFFTYKNDDKAKILLNKHNWKKLII
jgi:hypothetical protein